MSAVHDFADDHGPVVPQVSGVVGEPSQPGPIKGATPNDSSGQADALLLVLADALDDLERTRIANENRARALAGAKGLADTQAHVQLSGLVDALKTLEHGAELSLKRALRTHPLGPWVKSTIGVGEKQGGRLLAAIGDPYWNTLHDRPRTVSELWAYCGYHVLRPGHGDDDAHGSVAGSDPSGVAPSRRKGVRTNWNAAAKMRAFLVAESCIKKANSPYRSVYDEARAKYADATHQTECRRCGPRGNPAPVGSPLSAGHQHARGLRAVAKAVLRDLWIEAKRLHEEGAS